MVACVTNAEPSVPISSSSPNPARVRRVSVKNLFGWLDHDVELRREERVTILIGPNGVGKTRLLELVAAVAQGRVDQLVGVPFDELRIDFDDDRAVVVRRPADAKPLHAPKRGRNHRFHRADPAPVLPVEFLLFVGKHQKARWAPAEEVGAPGDAAWNLRGPFPWLRSIGAGRWVDARSGDVLTTRQLSAIYGVDEAMLRSGVKLPEWLHKLFDQRPVHLIETQRLVRYRPQTNKHVDPDFDDIPVVLVVNDVAEELARRVETAQSEYARQAQRLEKTYVERLLRPRQVDTVDVPKLLARLGNLAQRRARLEKLGLLAADAPQGTPTTERPAPDQVPVLDLFAADLELKLDVLDPLARSIELLVDSVNGKFRNKRLRLSLPEGLVVECEPQGRPIEVQALSSGEQHELVLLFDLIFRVQKNTLVLIDEPELSLHPEWQAQFVDDLVSIAQNSQFDVVLATHSPYIIGARNELCVELRAEPKG